VQPLERVGPGARRDERIEDPLPRPRELLKGQVSERDRSALVQRRRLIPTVAG
jgi:hypothetical protein